MKSLPTEFREHAEQLRYNYHMYDCDYHPIIACCHDVLEGFRDLDEALEYAELFKDRDFVNCDAYGYPISYNLIVEAIDIAKRFNIDWR